MDASLRHISGEIQVSTQLLSTARPDGQLRFEGDPIFVPPTFNGILKHYFIDEICEAMKAPSWLNFTFTSPYFDRPRHEVQHLFEPAPRCGIYQDLGDDALECHLDAGHDGSHYDTTRRIEWSTR